MIAVAAKGPATVPLIFCKQYALYCLSAKKNEAIDCVMVHRFNFIHEHGSKLFTILSRYHLDFGL